MKITRHLYSALTLTVFAVLFWASATEKQASKPINTKPSEPQCDISDKIDEFTKERSVTGNIYLIYTEKIDLSKSTLSDYNYQENSEHKSTRLDFYIFAAWENGQKIIELVRYVFQVENYLEFTASDPDPKIIFLLSNDEPLPIVPSRIWASTLNDKGWVSQRQRFEVNDSTWAKLRDFPPKKFRIRYLGSNYSTIYSKDFEIDENNRKKIPFALKCIDDLNLPH